MSIRLWEEIARQKEEIENQRQIILNTFKESKVAEKLGAMKAEKLFRPITRRMEPAVKPPVLEEDFYANLDRDLFEEGDIGDEMANLFDDGEELLREDEGVAPKYAPDDPDEEFPELGEEIPPGEKAKPPAKPAGPPPSYSSSFPRTAKRDADTVQLSSLEKYLKANEGKPNPKNVNISGLGELTYNQAKEEVKAIYDERAYDLLQGKSMGKKKLGPYEGKNRKQIREMLGMPESAFPAPKKTGKGLKPEDLIQRLTLGISSIYAGNTSLKLRKEITSIAKLLFKSGILSQAQKNKILSLK